MYAIRSYYAGVGKVLAVNATLQDASAMPYEMDRKTDDLSLAEYTRKGIQLLDNKKGFFMMVEGGNRITSYNVCYTKLLRTMC